MWYASLAISSRDGGSTPPVYFVNMPSPVRIAGMSEVCMADSWSIDWRQKGGTLVLHQEHQELGRRRLARVSADDVHVVQPLVEGLASHQCDWSPTLDLHHDAALEYVDERLRMMRMHRVHASRRVLDRDHREFSGRIPREILGHKCANRGFLRECV